MSYGQQPYYPSHYPPPQYYPGYPPGYPPPSEESNPLGLAGFVCSLIGLASCGCISPIGFLLSAVGCFFSPRGYAIAGLVMGIIGSWWLWAFGALMMVGFYGKYVVDQEQAERQWMEQQQNRRNFVQDAPQPAPWNPPAPGIGTEEESVEEIFDPAEGFRTWRSTAGTTVEARAVRMANGQVQLERRDGTTLFVPFDKLSAEDQAWIEARR